MAALLTASQLYCYGASLWGEPMTPNLIFRGHSIKTPGLAKWLKVSAAHTASWSSYFSPSVRMECPNQWIFSCYDLLLQKCTSMYIKRSSINIKGVYWATLEDTSNMIGWWIESDCKNCLTQHLRKQKIFYNKGNLGYPVQSNRILKGAPPPFKPGIFEKHGSLICLFLKCLH